MPSAISRSRLYSNFIGIVISRCRCVGVPRLDEVFHNNVISCDLGLNRMTFVTSTSQRVLSGRDISKT